MWRIFETKTVRKVIERSPRQVRVRYEAWKRIAEQSGPHGLRLIQGFRDEALRGERKGFRSSRLNRQWRLIYKVQKAQLEIHVVEVNPHEY
ncbi:MAG: type II toxin-antitoxin system mRNA interferase toxin, RelE/StbE family [Deltaproteobacteria bacterium]|nr:type II toxin-antitoxin system mRNA interferase toxin, RelE/StbE family [Deltaproteobacteria bacterium]